MVSLLSSFIVSFGFLALPSSLAELWSDDFRDPVTQEGVATGRAADRQQDMLRHPVPLCQWWCFRSADSRCP